MKNGHNILPTSIFIHFINNSIVGFENIQDMVLAITLLADLMRTNVSGPAECTVMSYNIKRGLGVVGFSGLEYRFTDQAILFKTADDITWEITVRQFPLSLQSTKCYDAIHHFRIRLANFDGSGDNRC